MNRAGALIRISGIQTWRVPERAGKVCSLLGHPLFTLRASVIRGHFEAFFVCMTMSEVQMKITMTRHGAGKWHHMERENGVDREKFDHVARVRE